MPIVRTDVPITSESCNEMILELVRTYPQCRSEQLTASAFQRPIRTLVLGSGERKVLFTAAHHANEWITALVLLTWLEENTFWASRMLRESSARQRSATGGRS